MMIEQGRLDSSTSNLIVSGMSFIIPSVSSNITLYIGAVPIPATYALNWLKRGANRVGPPRPMLGKVARYYLTI
jgi:hypothetical protein